MVKVEEVINKMDKTDIEKYISERKANNYINSIHTERAYRIKLNGWLNFCNGVETIENAQRYRDFLSLKFNNSILVRIALYVIGNFYDFMKQENPFTEIIKDFRVKKSDIALKAIERQEKALSYDEIQKMIKTSQHLQTKPKKANKIFIAQRNYLILMMLYRYGMRIDSLVNIKMDDIDFESNKIIIYKSKTIAYPIPISPIEQDLKLFITQRNQYFAYKRFKPLKNESDMKYLLTTQSGVRLNDRDARVAINAMAKIAKVYSTGRSTHQLRHFRATQNYKDGMSLDLISHIMGVGVNTLKSVYLHINTDDIIDQYEVWAKTKKGFVCPECGYSEQVQKEQLLKRDRLRVV